jgi:hypothetical protein
VPRVTLPATDHASARGWTPNELGQLLRVSPDRVRAWIRAGLLGAINTATHCAGKPRFVILPHHLAAFEHRRACGPAPKPHRGRRRQLGIDYYP